MRSRRDDGASIRVHTPCRKRRRSRSCTGTSDVSSRKSRMRLVCSALLLAIAAQAQEPFAATDSLGQYGRVVQSWIGLRVSPGHEAHAMDRIHAQLDDWTLGPLGSLVRTRGEGSPHRVVACGLDEPSY